MMEDYNYSYYCSLVLRDVKELEELISTLQNDVEGLIKKKEEEESVSFLLPLLVKGVEIASLIPNVKEELSRRDVHIKKEVLELEEDGGCRNEEELEWILEPQIECTRDPSGSIGSDSSFVGSDSDKTISKRNREEIRVGDTFRTRKRKKKRTIRTFNSQLQEKFAGVIVQSQKEGATKSGVTCLVCSKHFSIGNSAISQILVHLNTMKHKRNLKKKKDEESVKKDGEITEYLSIAPNSNEEDDNDDIKDVHNTRLVKVKEEEEQEVHVGSILGDDSDSNFYCDNLQEEGGNDGNTDIKNHSDDDDHDSDTDWVPCPEKKIRRRFTYNLQQKFRGVIVQSQEDVTNNDVTCLICGRHFSIENRGKNQILVHLKSKKHRKNLKRKEEEGSLSKDQIEVSDRFSSWKEDPTPIPVPIPTIIKEIVEQQESKTAEWKSTSGNPREYICLQCPEEDRLDLKQQNVLNQHIRHHHPSPYYHHSLVDESELTVVHQYVNSLEKPPFTCPVCKLDYEKKSGLEIHLERIHCVDQDRNRLDCTLCGKTFRTNRILKQHLKTHQPRPYSCSQCNSKFPTTWTRDNHIKLVHGERSFLCSHCGSAHPDKRRLEDHVMGAHEKLKRFKCDQCPAAYSWLHSLHMHKKTVHEGLTFLCNLCGTVCANKTILKRHIISVHENPGSFPCDICSKTFRHKRGLAAHIKRHQRKNNISSMTPTLAQQLQ